MIPESSEAGAPQKLQQTLDQKNAKVISLDTFSSKDYNLPMKTNTRTTRNCTPSII
jgi:uridine kinase